MGKKRIIKKGQEEALAEQKGVDQNVQQSGSKLSAAKKVREGRIYVYSSFNNTLASLTDAKGSVIAQASSGAIGFKGSKKSTPFAASKVIETIAQIAYGKGIEKVEIYVKGVGSGRDSALRSLAAKNFEISAIKDVTPIPHNGPKPPRARRV